MPIRNNTHDQQHQQKTKATGVTKQQKSDNTRCMRARAAPHNSPAATIGCAPLRGPGTRAAGRAPPPTTRWTGADGAGRGMVDRGGEVYEKQRWLAEREKQRWGSNGEEMGVRVPGSECASKVQALVRVGAGAARKVNVQWGTDGSKALKMLDRLSVLSSFCAFGEGPKRPRASCSAQPMRRSLRLTSEFAEPRSPTVVVDWQLGCCAPHQSSTDSHTTRPRPPSRMMDVNVGAAAVVESSHSGGRSWCNG